MIFSCFRPRKREEAPPKDAAKIKSQRDSAPKEKKSGRPCPGLALKNAAPVRVKLAPRSAILHSPKQEVGARITEATLQSRRGNEDALEPSKGQTSGSLKDSGKVLSRTAPSKGNTERMSVSSEADTALIKDKKPEQIERERAESPIPAKPTRPIPAPPTVVNEDPAPRGGELCEEPCEEPAAARPKSPSGLRPLFAGQQDELRAALAKRAAKSSAHTKDRPNIEE